MRKRGRERLLVIDIVASSASSICKQLWRYRSTALLPASRALEKHSNNTGKHPRTTAKNAVKKRPRKTPQKNACHSLINRAFLSLPLPAASGTPPHHLISKGRPMRVQRPPAKTPCSARKSCFARARPIGNGSCRALRAEKRPGRRTARAKTPSSPSLYAFDDTTAATHGEKERRRRTVSDFRGQRPRRSAEQLRFCRAFLLVASRRISDARKTLRLRSGRQLLADYCQNTSNSACTVD